MYDCGLKHRLTQWNLACVLFIQSNIPSCSCNDKTVTKRNGEIPDLECVGECNTRRPMLQRLTKTPAG